MTDMNEFDESEATDEANYGLVMPFVTVASRGATHDDESYVAGYAMGILDAQLSSDPAEHMETVRESSLPQADLLAMRHGYSITSELPEDGWSTVRFVKIEAP
jgi:hypothetical protein